MRKILALIFGIFIGTSVFSQKDGYKTIKVGNLFDSIELYNSYKITQIADNGFRLISLTSQTFCDIELAYIDVKITDDGKINLIQLYTKESNYEDVDQFLKAYDFISKCIVNTVGKANYYDPGNDAKDGLLRMAWIFEKENKILVLSSNSLAIYERNVPRHFLIAWTERSSKAKMW
ncbi:MAG: hypothetical protein HYZ15_05460 [Sphingobacteriales bacterium]|nr:hypothetical protein [Sphingobacteriales bacterium]